jgi:hypothetical protein
MFNFLVWSLPFLGVSMIVVPMIMISILIVAWLFGEKYGERATIIVIAMLMIWGLWVGCYHLYPFIESHNNLCPPDQQTAGYCDTGTK